MRSRPGQRRHRGARTLWALAVLGLLNEHAMHPYEMQRQLHQRHTDELLALKRGSLYHAINQLQRDGFIEPIETSRAGRWPERTVYRITPDGQDELVDWLRDLLSTPAREPSEFVAALAHILQLEPADALEQLELRMVNLAATIAAWQAVERGVGERIGRVAILELEYARCQAQAEFAWVGSVIDDLKTGTLNWDIDKIKKNINITEHQIDNDSPREGPP
jgi:DNA-binding PadR family transcriptional regulator